MSLQTTGVSELPDEGFKAAVATTLSKGKCAPNAWSVRSLSKDVSGTVRAKQTNKNKKQYLKFKSALDGFNSRMDTKEQRVNFSTEVELIQYEEGRFSEVDEVLRTVGQCQRV